MSNVTIKQVEGGQTNFPALDDAIELQTSSASRWAYLSDLPSAIRLPMGTIFNAYISPSVSSNNLVVTLVGMGGTALSSTKPAVFHSYSSGIKRVSSPLTLTISAGTNTFNAGSAELATKEIDLFVYLGYNATDGVVLGVSRWPGATQYGDFSTTATNEKYAAISTTTNAAATDTYYVIGRFAATLSAGAGYTWTVPTYTPLNLVQHPIWETRVLDFVPQFTNLTVGAGTLTGKYQIVQNRLTHWTEWTYGASSGVSGSVTYTFPFAYNSTYYAGTSPNCIVRLYDSNPGVGYTGLGYLSSAKMLVTAQKSDGTYLAAAVLSATVPFTWASGDILSGMGTYFI